MAEELYRSFPDADEGWLSRARATIVRATTLAETAEAIHSAAHPGRRSADEGETEEAPTADAEAGSET